MTEVLIKNGLFIIEGAPDRPCLPEFMREIKGMHASTHYGDENWFIANKPGSKDLPNSSKKLELHIDMPYLTNPCQVYTQHNLLTTNLIITL